MRTRILMSVVVALAMGCGDDDTTILDSSVDMTTGDMTTGDMTTGDLAVGGDDIPVFPLAECGSQVVAETMFSNLEAMPSPMAVNTIVKGRIDPDAAANNVHYWQADLPAGFYHFVLDEKRLDGRDSNNGIRIELLEVDDEVEVLRSSHVEKSIRTQSFVEVQNSGTLTFRVTPRFEAEDYAFGIFTNGESVASPFFQDCPTITPLTLGAEVSRVVREYEDISRADEIWYTFDAEIADYDFTTSGSRVDGRDSNVQYRVEVLDEFGDIERATEVVRVNETGLSATGEGTLNITEPGPVWIRLIGKLTDLNLSMTVTKQ